MACRIAVEHEHRAAAIFSRWLPTADSRPEHPGFHFVTSRLPRFPEVIVDAKGKQRKRYPYERMMTPYEKLKSLPKAERFLKPGVTFEELNALALQMSDNEAAISDLLTFIGEISMVSEYLVDDAFAKHFRSLHQVFMYITDRCNLECEQCIYKPSISHFINEEIPLPDALGLLQTFRRLGASKVTFLGGEPTLYGHKQRGKPLLNIIVGTKQLGYEYIRLDTNGQKTSAFLRLPQFSILNEVAFSLDGFSPQTNDPLRGNGTFVRAHESIRLALELGYHVTITCCVQKILLTRDSGGALLLERMIRFAEQLGVHQINFHDLFKVGIPMDTWTGSFAPKPVDWLPVYEELAGKVTRNEFSISVRLPQCFVKKVEFDRNPEYYGYCPVKLGERVMVHPNGVIRICSNLICTGFGVARYERGRIGWDHSHNNEMAGHDLERNTPCTNRSRHRKYGNLVPVCFSFKPGQEEFIWEKKLDWETKRRPLNEGAA